VKGAILEFLSILFADRDSKKFFISVILGLAFSMSVILCTLGLMDGYLSLFKKGLSKFEGEVTVHSRSGFFEIDKSLKQDFLKSGAVEVAGYVQTEGFIVHQEISKGILLKAIEPKAFSKVTGFDFSIFPGEIVLGKELAKSLSVEPGEKISIVLSDGGKQVTGMPSVHQFKVKSLVDHKIYEKNMRLAYLNLSEVAQLMGLENRINMISLRLENSSDYIKDESLLEKYMISLEDLIGFDYIVRPYWHGLGSMFDAVRAEKFMIGLSVQLIVIVSMFNVVAFLIFFNEKRSREIFLLRALGVSNHTLTKGWVACLFIFWVVSCAGSVLLTYLFNWLLKKLFIFQLPGDVYKLVSLEIDLGLGDYFFVFLVALFWFVAMSIGVLRKIRRQGVLQGLRREFA